MKNKRFRITQEDYLKASLESFDDCRGEAFMFHLVRVLLQKMHLIHSLYTDYNPIFVS